MELGMPLYEYRCLDCRRSFEVRLSYAEHGTKKVACPWCKSENIQQRIRRVRFGRSDGTRMQDLADPATLDTIDEDPRALGKMMRKMSSELGQDMGSEFHEVVDRLEKGQSPEQIEHDLPEIGQESSLPTGGDDF
jgi:putative FmdB family regulatory protein